MADFIEGHPGVVIAALVALGVIVAVSGRNKNPSQFTGTVTTLPTAGQQGASYITPDQLQNALNSLYQRISAEQAARYTESRPLIPYQGGY